jgi:hypothetical protein
MTFSCPKCGAPGQVILGMTTYTCVCRFGAFVATTRPMTEADVRRIVQEELQKRPADTGAPPETAIGEQTSGQS